MQYPIHLGSFQIVDNLMVHAYLDSVNGGEFYLKHGESNPRTNYYHQKNPKDYYTIVFNLGPVQQVQLDGVNLLLPQYGILPIMFSQVYSFDQPEEMLIWQFNREFYCIVNHDKEVGCVGFLFYGAWGNLVLSPNEKNRNKVLLLAEVFKDEFADRDDIQGAMLRMLLVRLIITITRIAKENIVPNADVDPSKFDLLRQYNLLVEKHYKQQHEVQFYAAQLFKSPKTLSNAFARFAAKTPLQIIHERLILEAKRLFSYTDSSIKEIAVKLGFKDAGHFTRFFKKQSGLNPSDFRKGVGNSL